MAKKFVNIKHKGLKGLIERNDARGLDPRYARKIRNMIALLRTFSSEDEVTAFKRWKGHQLKGRREGTWSLWVSGNWRLTFDVDSHGTIRNLDLEDYHD